jgi:hypothetical protein
MPYNITAFYKKKIISRFEVTDDDVEDTLYNQLALPMIKKGFNKGYNIGIQMKL